MELKCSIQQYAWGKIGSNSEVAQLSSNSDPDFLINETLPYAELWMGVHPNGPSVIKGSSHKLSDWLAAHPDHLGSEVVKHFGNQLPFLFKVLSVNKALSIQVHPNKAHAEELHSLWPDVYKDPNHKPELAIALTRFEALFGFRPINEIKHFLQDVPELKSVVGEEAVAELSNSDETGAQEALKKCFKILLTTPSCIVQKQLNALLKRMETISDGSSQDNDLAKLVQRLHCNFPGDVGIFCVYFLNWLELKPGECLYIGANEPHAYLLGDCIEAMACSDNVVRAGLTPKYRDVTTLCSMLTYRCSLAASNKLQGQQEDSCTVVFRPPVPDFAVAKIIISPAMERYKLLARKSASIILITEGEGTSDTLKLKRGSVLFLSANQDFSVTPIQQIVIFQAFTNV